MKQKLKEPHTSCEQEEGKRRWRNFKQWLLILNDEKSGRIAKQHNTKNKSFNIAHISEDLTYLFLMTEQNNTKTLFNCQCKCNFVTNVDKINQVGNNITS